MSIEGQTRSILLVDDDREVLIVTAHMLRSLDFIVFAVPSYETALVTWKEHSGQFSFLVVDFSLGCRSGGDLAEHFLQVKPRLPIVIMTGFDVGSLDLPEILRRNVTFLEKPFSVGDLQKALNSSRDHFSHKT